MTDDGGLTGTTRVTVDINRNLNKAIFDARSCNTTILETLSAGSLLGASVTAVDADSTVRIGQ